MVKIGNLDFFKLKNFCSDEDLVKRMKRKVRVGESTYKRDNGQKTTIENI